MLRSTLPARILTLVIALLLAGCSVLSTSPRPPRGADRGAGESADPQPVLTYRGISGGDLLGRLRQGFSLPDHRHSEVRRFEDWYRRHPAAAQQMVDQGSWALPYVLEAVETRGYPTEIALLPAVESGFDPLARSTGGAAGIWQFTAITARHMDLERNRWIDQRLELEASTTAALDYLEELRRTFDGDWMLALMAYNAGAGRVKQALNASRLRGAPPDYRRLGVSRESREFVPRLLALRNVVRDPGQFGIALEPVPNRPQHVRVELPTRIDHASVADACNADTGTITALNAEHLLRVTPPGGPHRVRVPLPCAGRIDDLAASGRLFRPEPEPEQQYAVHVVAAGDTLWEIANAYRVPVRELAAVNGTGEDLIRPGQHLRIPGRGEEGPARVVHQVRSGDTLSDLARTYRVSARAIADWNRIALDSTLSLGQGLLIYTP